MASNAQQCSNRFVTIVTAKPRSPRQKFRKGDRSRRMWTVREEEILGACLIDLVARGWKSDNGFRTGYLGKIEDAIRKEFPKDIKGQPHVTSKLTAWKKSYTSLGKLLARSGVGFNSDNEYKIECDDDQWEAIVMVSTCMFAISDKVYFNVAL